MSRRPEVGQRMIYNLAGSRMGPGLMALANRLPLPISRLAVRVGGHTMSGHTLDRLLALLFWKFSVLEGYERRLVRQFVQPGMCAVDIGANVGLYTLLLAECVGDQGRVWAFEPEPAAFCRLQANVDRNGYGERVTTVGRAVSRFTGGGTLYLSESNQGDHALHERHGRARASVPVQMVSLDDFFSPGQPVDFLKVDAQGAEALVVQGAERVLLEQPRVRLLLEFSPEGLRMAGSSSAELLALLRGCGLTLEHVDSAHQSLVRIYVDDGDVELCAGSSETSILAWK
jgi:FkbM family methyltransferase